MPVVLTTPYVPAAPSFDKVHLDHLVISLERTDYSKAKITARMRLYSGNPTNGKTFDKDTFEVNIDDAEQFATQLALQGDMRGVQMDTHIRELVALLIETQTNLGDATVVV